MEVSAERKNILPVGPRTRQRAEIVEAGHVSRLVARTFVGDSTADENSDIDSEFEDVDDSDWESE